TGDPWNGRTLEWMTSSPPQFYNFAEEPRVHDVDELAYRKEHGIKSDLKTSYAPIHMPKNTGAGFIISAFSLVFGFAAIWHI
ncbi:cytochrome o ubiquinol oxidase subunit I, partial [Klebsiella pneumoniae]